MDEKPKAKSRKPKAQPKKPEVDKPVAKASPGEGTPDGEKLALAERAFEEGDHRRVRELCAPLAGAHDDAVAAAASALLRRVSIDPVQVGFLIGCLAFLLVMVYVYVIR